MPNEPISRGEVWQILLFWEQHLADPAMRAQLTNGQFPDQLVRYLDPARSVYHVLDAGFAPISQIGSELPGKTVNVFRIDPLAEEYCALLDRLEINNTVRPIKLAPEDLDKVFARDTFDLVVADNSLDQMVDPVEAVRQMIRATRPGGWIVLGGALLEGAVSSHAGRRQWNLEVQDGRLLVRNDAVARDLLGDTPWHDKIDLSVYESNGYRLYRAAVRKAHHVAAAGAAAMATLLNPSYARAMPEHAAKAAGGDMLGRFREIVADPLNLLIERDPRAGVVENGLVWLHNGNRVPIDGPSAYYGRFSDVLIINRGVHEPLEEYIFQEVLRVVPEDPMMLELGAYWSHYSMWMKRRRPEARVFMVEPEAENLETGRANFARHGYDGTFIQAFVGNGQFEVDRFVREHSHPRINILHVDIQGFEVEMLEGCAESFSRGLIDYAFISTHAQSLHDLVVVALSASGMRVEISSGFDFETTSFDGFIFASRAALPPVFSGLKPIGRRDLMLSVPTELVSYLVTTSGLKRGALSSPATSDV